MKVGVLPFLSRDGGGGFQYTLTLLEQLAEVSAQSSDDFELLFPDYLDAIELTTTGNVMLGGMRLRSMVEITYKQAEPRTGSAPPSPPLRPVDDPEFDPRLHGRMKGMGMDWLLTPNSTSTVFASGLPYVAPIHDLQHLLQPEFPEVSADGQAEKREYLYRNLARYSLLVLADSEVGREDILNAYGKFGVTEDMVKILPFLPAHYQKQDVEKEERQRVRDKYALPERYFFYPAQFWSHKNHLRIVEAVAQMQTSGLKASLVFSGINKSYYAIECFRAVMEQANRLGLADRVLYVGLVPDEDMSALYAESEGLVMPTFFGPTNIPVLEAWGYGVPVITSDIRGVREQIGDAGLLVDPRSSESIAEAMVKIWQGGDIVTDLVARGHQRLSEYTPRDFRSRLAGIVAEASQRMKQGLFQPHPKLGV